MNLKVNKLGWALLILTGLDHDSGQLVSQLGQTGLSLHGLLSSRRSAWFFHGSCITLKAISKVAPTRKRFSFSVFVTFNIVLLAKVNHLAKLRVCVRGEYQRVWMQGGMNKQGPYYNLHKPLT